MVVQQISERQVADLVTSLARGRTVAETATRLRLPSEAVDFIGRQNGFPDIRELNANSRLLNKRLRDAPPAEDVDTDVPVTPETDTGTATSGFGTSGEVEEPEVVDEPDVVLWRCTECDFDVVGPESARYDIAVHSEITDHQDGHRLKLGPDEIDALRNVLRADDEMAAEGTVVIPGPIHTHELGVRRHDCAACRDEAVQPPVVVPGEIDESMSEAIGMLSVAGHLAETDAAEVATTAVTQFDLSGSTVPEPLGQVLATMGGRLARLAGTADSPSPLPSGEAVPDAADMSEQHGVRDDAGWLAPRSIEQLLDEAEATNHAPLVGLASGLRRMVQELADRLDRWVDHVDQRKAILHELDVLGRRRDELTEKLARLDAETDAPAPSVVASQTRTMFSQARTDLAAAILEEEASKPEPAPKLDPKSGRGLGFADRTALWFQLPTEVRARVKPWCEDNGVPHASTGRQPKAALEAYLAAHPEDDPR